MGLKDLMHMIFGTGESVPKNPKLTRREAPTKHWGSKKKYDRKTARRLQKTQKASRKKNR